jgi:uncharacterized protein
MEGATMEGAGSSMESDIAKKLASLRSLIQREPGVFIALSGGTDSTLLCFIAHSILGAKVHAVTARSEFLDPEETDAIERFVDLYGIRHSYLTLSLLENETVRKNPQDRCFHCKSAIFQQVKKFASEHGFQVIPDSEKDTYHRKIHIFDGTNTDDLLEVRPGIRALWELGIRSPFVEVGMGKADIIQSARDLGLGEFIRPSNSCLATRIGENIPITEKILSMVQKAEEYLRGMGFTMVRVRYHEPGIARIEIPSSEILNILEGERARTVSRTLRQIGFNRVSVDIDGYIPDSFQS